MLSTQFQHLLIFMFRSSTATASIHLVLVGGCVNTFGLFFKPIQERFDTSATATTWIAATMQSVGFLTGESAPPMSIFSVPGLSRSMLTKHFKVFLLLQGVGLIQLTTFLPYGVNKCVCPSSDTVTRQMVKCRMRPILCMVEMGKYTSICPLGHSCEID